MLWLEDDTKIKFKKNICAGVNSFHAGIHCRAAVNKVMTLSKGSQFLDSIHFVKIDPALY